MPNHIAYVNLQDQLTSGSAKKSTVILAIHIGVWCTLAPQIEKFVRRLTDERKKSEAYKVRLCQHVPMEVVSWTGRPEIGPRKEDDYIDVR